MNVLRTIPGLIKLSLSIFLFFSLVGECSAFDFASFWQETPGKNEISREKWNNSYSLILQCKKRNSSSSSRLVGLKRWYFYKDYVLGEYNSEEGLAYFSFYEPDCLLMQFTSEVSFNEYLEREKLKPLFRRWYNKNWGMLIFSGEMGSDLELMFIYIPLILIFCLIAIFVFYRSRGKPKTWKHKVLIIVACLIVLRYFLDVFPQSFF